MNTRFCEQETNKQKIMGTIEDRITRRRDVKKKREKKLGNLYEYSVSGFILLFF